MVEQVLDTEALQPTKAQFLATHHPIRVYRAASTPGASPSEYTERDFLRDFLAPKDYVFAVVLGEAGTGKSHLIRWLEMNISSSAKRRVLLIPKVGTNLKSVIARILEGLEGDKFADYRRRLDEGTVAIGDLEARERLLDNLCIAVGPNQARDRKLTDMESFLSRSLPDFLRDPVLRRDLLKDGGRVAELVVHALGKGERIERLDRPKEFVVNDLPMNVTDQRDLSSLARNFHAQLLGSDQLVVATVAWINDNLGVALRQMINFTGENLSELMLDVREALAESDIELVMLVEDFAKLQGLDRQLLESFLVRTHQEGRKPLCALRTALALTTGYFDRLDETVKDRIKFRVVMDVASAQTGGLVTAEDLERFATRYLNAVRLPELRLQRWLNEADGDTPSDAAPSACEGCPYREPCHAAFGERDGYGLYPFNALAVRRMSARVSPQKFNPRTIINRVLKDTFEKYTDSLRDGEFPPPALHKQFGRSQLSASLTNELRQRDPLNFGRRQALLDLWSEGLHLVDLPAGVHEAFSLPPLGTQIVAPPERDKHSSADDQTSEGRGKREVELPPGLVAQLEELNNWNNGAPLSQRLVQTLREIVYRSVVEHVDWDAEFLVRKAFAGGGGSIFQQRYVTFSNKESRERTGAYQLNIPVAPEQLNEAALALQGLLLHQHFGHWQFLAGNHPGGPRLRREFARQIEFWSTDVLAQVSRPTKSGAVWDPVPAATELLMLGARLHGRPAKTDATLAEHIESMFAEWPIPADDEHRGSEWRDLASSFRRRRSELLDLVLFRIAATKGGSARVQIIDATRIRTTASKIVHTWIPTEDLLSDARTEYAFLADLRSRLASGLAPAVEAERLRLLAWDGRVSEELGGATRSELQSAIRSVLEAAERVGVSSSNQLATILDSLPASSLDKVRKSIERLRNTQDLSSQLVEVSRDAGNVIGTLMNFFTSVESFFSKTEDRLRFDQSQGENGGISRVQTTERELVESLDALHAELTVASTRGK